MAPAGGALKPAGIWDSGHALSVLAPLKAGAAHRAFAPWSPGAGQPGEPGLHPCQQLQLHGRDAHGEELLISADGS